MSDDERALIGRVIDGRFTIESVLGRGGMGVVFRARQASLDRSIQLMAPFARVFTNTLGNGRWFDSYIQNLVVPTPVVPRTGGAR